ncbi:hypothetical protein [Achromobacter xylosoxidans]
MDKPIGSSLPSPAIRPTTPIPSAAQVERGATQPEGFDQLMQAYTKDWHPLYADGSKRDTGSYERLAGNTLAAIAWLSRTPIGKGAGEAARAADTLNKSFGRTCNQEEVPSVEVSRAIVDEIVRIYQDTENVGAPSKTTVALANSVLKAVSKRMHEAGGDSALKARDIEKIDAAELLREMEQNDPTSDWTAGNELNESLYRGALAAWANEDPLYRYALTAWANFGSSDEAPQRAKALNTIFRNPRSVYLDDLGLTSLPTLPMSLMILVASKNQLTRLPALPAKLETLRVSDNRLVIPPILPNRLRDLDLSFNELGTLSMLPKTLEKVRLDGIDFHGLPLDSFQQLKSSTRIWIELQRDAELQAKLESFMKKRDLDVIFCDPVSGTH